MKFSKLPHMATPDAIAQEAEQPSSETCSRCQKPLDADGSPRWCKACRAKYQRDYQALKKEMSESRGFAAGCSAMRDTLAKHFEQFQRARFSGAEIAKMIRRAGSDATV